jgi:hypothetical protein
LTTSEIIKSLNITAHTAHRTMTELNALGLVDGIGLAEKSNTEKKIKLKNEFSWFLSEEFQRLRESFDYVQEEQQQRPGEEQPEHEEKNPLSSQKNEDVISTEEVTDEHEEHEENESELEEKIPPTNDNNSSLSTADTSLEPKKLEIKFTPDYNEKEPVFWRVIDELSNDGLVDYDKLHERLVSTGQLFVGEAVPMIEHMEKIGRIEKTEDYNIYRIKESSPNGKGGNEL